MVVTTQGAPKLPHKPHGIKTPSKNKSKRAFSCERGSQANNGLDGSHAIAGVREKRYRLRQ